MLAQITQVDHKDTLGIIKERRIDTNMYSQISTEDVGTEYDTGNHPRAYGQFPLSLLFFFGHR